MTGQHSYSSHPYPPSSASGGSQGAYVDAYPSYDYSSTSTPSLPEYQQQASPQIRFAPSSSYQPSSRSRYSSHPSSRHSAASSEAEEQGSSHARAPVHAVYVGPGQGQGPSVVSPSPLYDQPPEHNRRQPDQQHHYAHHHQQQQQQHADYDSPYSAPVTRASSRTDRPPQSMFARAPPSHTMTDDVTYVSTRSHHLPAGVVGASDGWVEGAPLDLPLPPKVTASSSSSSSATKKKAAASSQAPRKRVPASCTPCRKKKLRCNRSMPCSSCVERGDPEGCVWDGDAVPLFVAREETDVKELKAQVDRLQHLLDAFSESTPPVSARTSPTTRAADAVAQQAQQHYMVVEQDEVPALELATFDLRAQDLCAALAELALKGFLPTQQSGAESFAPNGVSGEAFLDEAERFVRASTAHGPSPAASGFTVLTPTSIAPSPPSSTPISSSSSPSALALTTSLLGQRPALRQILALLPSDDELRSTYQAYASSVHWHSAPIGLGDLEERWTAFRRAVSQPDEARREREVDPLFVAILLAACASGLASMTTQQAQAQGFPDNRSAIVERWIGAAMLSLVAGKFMEQPSLDGIRAAAIIASLYLEQFMTTGETMSAGMSLLSLAVNAVFSLGLHLDPSRSSKEQLSFANCEERRRLFWCIFSLSTSVTSGTSRACSGFDLRQINCMFPLDCYDAELDMDERAAKARVRSRRAADAFEETPMTVTVLRAQQSLLAKKITDKAFSVTPCTYDDILALDADLIAFEKSLPPAYELPVDGANRVQLASPPSSTEMRAALIQLYLTAEFVRLHRPFLVLAATDDRYQHSREQCVKYGKRLLAINATPGCQLDWAGHNFKVISAAVALAIELLQSPAEPDAPVIRNGIDLVLKRVEGFAGVSTVCRKGSSVIRFVLSKVDDELANSSAPRRAKRARTLRYSPESDWSRRPSLARALGGAPTAASSRATSPDDHVRRRKTTRPVLVHMASDTFVPRVTATDTAIKPQAPFLRMSRSRSADQSFPTLNALDALATKGPHSAEATYAPTYTVAPPARQIAGLGSANSRRARDMSTAASGVDATLAALATFSPPDSSLHLHLPSSPYRDGHSGPATASTTGGFDFGELSLAGGAPSGSSGSVLDDGDMQDLFGLSSVTFQGSPQTAPGDLRLADEPERASSAVARSSSGSKFNVPINEEDFAYLHQYQN
ncbi:hypothetical protein JCM9279_002533 [Rhodotorula babjevae]